METKEQKASCQDRGMLVVRPSCSLPPVQLGSITARGRGLPHPAHTPFTLSGGAAGKARQGGAKVKGQKASSRFTEHLLCEVLQRQPSPFQWFPRELPTEQPSPLLSRPRDPHLLHRGTRTRVHSQHRPYTLNSDGMKTLKNLCLRECLEMIPFIADILEGQSVK